MATGTIKALPYVKYCENTGDADTFADGVTIVTTSALNTASASERCAIFTATLLSNPIRKVQFELSTNGHIYTRYNMGSWTSWAEK